MPFAGRNEMEARMDAITTLCVLAGVLCVSLSLGVAFEKLLICGMFKLWGANMSSERSAENRGSRGPTG